MPSELASFAIAVPNSRGREYTIGDLAREFGVSLRTLRFYEDRGMLTPRREGATRYYTARDRDRLSVILKGKALGFTLSEIQQIVSRETPGGVGVSLDVPSDAIEQQIAHLERQLEETLTALAELRAMRQRPREAA